MHPNDYRVTPGKNTFFFPSVSTFGNAIAADPKNADKLARRDYESHWTGESFAKSIERCQTGNTDLVPAAEAMLREIEKHIDLETLRPEFVPCVAGAFPNVPDFLANEPECMRRKVSNPNNSVPVNIAVCTTSSGGVEFKALEKRGCALLALVLALQSVRPVSITTFTALHGSGSDTVIQVKLQTDPVCISECAYALTSAGYDRNLTHSLGFAHTGFNGGWSRGIEPLLHGRGGDPAEKAMLLLREQLGCTGREDLVIPPTLYNDPIVKDPIAWVVKRLEDYKRVTEFDYEN